jgi:hypothetical protein
MLIASTSVARHGPQKLAPLLTKLEQDCLNVVAELAGKGDPPTTEEVAIELDVPFATARNTLRDLSRLAAVRVVEGDRWRPCRRVAVKLPPEPVFFVRIALSAPEASTADTVSTAMPMKWSSVRRIKSIAGVGF